jgi:hypothetical protein
MQARSEMSNGTKRVPDPVYLVVDPGDLGLLIEEIDAMSAPNSGHEVSGGWVNLLPRIPEDVALPATPGPFAVFSKRGPAVPMASWVVEAPKRKRAGPTLAGPTPSGSTLAGPTLGEASVEIGILHPAAGPVRALLQPLPDGFHVTQDHPKRGLVIRSESTSTIDTRETVAWVLASLTELCRVDRRADFDAVVYRRRDHT